MTQERDYFVSAAEEPLPEPVFISYRRDDSKQTCKAIYNALSVNLGEHLIFMDIDRLQPGEDFPKRLRATLDQCACVLVVIGHKWLEIQDARGKRRLEDSHDWVRLEVETALQRRRKGMLRGVIPVLVDDTQMPHKGTLPKRMADLADIHAFRIRNGEYLDDDLEELVAHVKGYCYRGYHPEIRTDRHKKPKPVPMPALPLREVVSDDLSAGGALWHSLPGYEERPAQIEMARAVADALESGSHLVCEAGTGTGKSLAYLLPIIRSGKVALISTANKNLQEQLFYKDIPFVQKHIQLFKSALVKGMGNYLCLDRLEEERGFQQIVKTPAFRIMEELIGDPDVWDGDFDVLPHALPNDVRARLSTDSDGCAWRGCPHFAECYVRRMRERARDAQVIVVNHTLLLLDAAMGGWLLPERDVVVIDEAHHLEEEATRAFTVTVSPGRVASLLAQRRLRNTADAQRVMDAAEADQALWAALQRVIRPDARGRQLLDEPIQEGLRLATAIQEVAESLTVLRPPNQDDKEQQLYEKLIKRTRSLAADLRVVFGEQRPDERVYYAEQIGGQGRRAGQWSASAAPLDVRELLREQLFDKIPTIATSATLAVKGDFGFFRSRVGLESAREAVLPLAFDYETHALLYVPRMRLEPAYGAASGPYLDELADQMRSLVAASDGRAFLLFSSQRALSWVYERLADELTGAGYSLIVQGHNLGRPEMLRRFRELPSAVLFGLKSFWEGVDIAGEALSLVVVDKLPFDPPDDPVNEARVQQMKDAGRNWFGEYTLPLAVLRLKQGIGRLLRTRDDRGVMAILDKRLYTKGYGRQVLAALPPARRSDQIADVRAFFQSD